MYREFRPGDVRFSQADIGEAKRLLGYRPQLQLSEGLARAVGWYVASLAPQPPILGAVSARGPEGSGSPILNLTPS
jgi:UDP-N-acetylglucosamine 4-epimerase